MNCCRPAVHFPRTRGEWRDTVRGEWRLRLSDESEGPGDGLRVFGSDYCHGLMILTDDTKSFYVVLHCILFSLWVSWSLWPRTTTSDPKRQRLI